MMESTILSHLIDNSEYGRKVIPFLSAEYFQDINDRTVFQLINTYVDEYNAFPTKEALLIDLGRVDSLTDDQFKECKNIITNLKADPSTEMEWLLDNTEKFCQDRALYNAITKSIKIMGNDKGNVSKGGIPQLLADALSVSFDTSIGHDFFDNFLERYDFYHRVENKIPFDLTYFNNITKGGLAKKTLNIALAGTGVGKSLFMCHCAASNLLNGHNVLYITLEMSEEKIAERIDANILNVTVDELAMLPRDAYEKKITRAKEKTTGKLIIKEYPTSSAGSANFRHLLNELKIKRNFVPDIIYIDYLNICASSRLKHGANVNSYTYIKSIAEELRGLAVEFNVPVVSATQTTRSGFTSSDIGLEDTSESFGLPATADFMFAIISTEELQTLGQYLVKQLKNRYSDPNLNKRFVIGVDRPKMKLFDVEQGAQDDIINDIPTPDKPRPGDRQKAEKFDKSVFDNFS